MGTTLWLLSGLAVVAAPLPANTPRTVTSQPPSIVLIHEVDKAKMLLNISTSYGISEFSMKGVVVYDPEGKVVPPDTYWKRLKAGTVVLMSWGGEKVDPVFLQFARPETLILVQGKEAFGPPEEIRAAPTPEVLPAPKPAPRP